MNKWYKGNLHTHSYWSDGDEFPEVIMDWYKRHDYHFVALSDHNTLAEGDRWVTIRKDSMYQEAFQDYLNSYGENWVTYSIDTGVTRVKLKTLEEYRSKFEEEEQFLIIASEEITDQYDRKPIHLNATNIQETIEPQGGGSVSEVLQNNIDAVLRQREALQVPMIPHVNHPNFGYALTVSDMIQLEGERFFEVYNGHPQVHNTGDSTHVSTEEMWDLINIAYVNNDQPLMYGLATDDAHHYHRKGESWSNAGRGWIYVNADSLKPRSLIAAMEAGNFYASTGVELEETLFQDHQLSVKVKAVEGIDYEISFIGCRKGNSTSEEFLKVNGTSAQFELESEHLFVRCKITSSKLHPNPVENIRFESAWVQPVRIGD
ncbi:CehA/McbA family metallohydrolase domain-containing protein [Portibacter marinus]|uniref:hypothetical protein n=1 Tax=Portibacter marinus TaxID=2898660 RepID=UPI001F316906|nr:hypothetical protein [Portibacter marinus]